MNIAAVIVCYNDDYKLNEWEEHYNIMKEAIYRSIIVDNGSDAEFIQEVKRRFHDATVMELGKNLGCTGAYNAGIRMALLDENVDAIMLIGNDIRILPEAIKKLTIGLEQDGMLGMVSPVLLNKDSNIIADAGCFGTYFLTLRASHEGEIYDKDKLSDKYCFALTGGMNLATRSFYEHIGLQDELLFMYSDEIDMGIRAAKHNIKMKVIRDAVAWHQHINPRQRKTRLPYSRYLIARNKVYLGKKHYGMFRAWIIFMYFVGISSVLFIRNLFKMRDTQGMRYAIWGAWNGLKGDMTLPKKFELF